ncbi:hypothetical protein BJX62DRAFT_204950 [Aspergillus germanicus]
MKPGRRRESGIVQLICSLSTSLAGYWPRRSSSSARRVIIDRPDELCIGYNCFPCPRRLILTVQEEQVFRCEYCQHCTCPSNSACCHIIGSLALVISGMTMGLERNIPRIPRSKEFCRSPGRSPLPSISLSTWLAE